MILIGQIIMSPNGDRNFILTQCELSVDFSFLRSLRASQLDAIYYILLQNHIYMHYLCTAVHYRHFLHEIKTQLLE